MRFASSRDQHPCFLKLLLLTIALSSWSAATAQTGVQPETSAKGSLANDVARSADPGLLKEINEIQAIDNHSHPPSLTPNGEKDDDYDALPCDPLEPTDAGLMFREDNPVYIKAWQKMFGYKYDDFDPEHVKELLAAKEKVKEREGDNYPNWVLQQLGIETELANRIALGPGQHPPYFLWVPFDDALLFPLNNSSLALQSPDRHIFFGREEALFARYMNDLGSNGVPPTLAQYTAKILTPLLEMQRKNGAVAIKFEAAYLRSLDFAPAKEAAAAQVYAKYVRGGFPGEGEYKVLQDYLFRYIAREAGRLGLAVHIHTGGGCGGYFYLDGSNPLLLDSVFNDPALRKTNFVMLHAGAAGFEQVVPYLLMKPNVYADFSEQTWMTSTRHLAASIRAMLEFYPDKVLFGTDLYPFIPQVNWEETGYATTTAGRTALALALTGMMQDGEITREQASQFARKVMRGNAIKLYGLSSAP
jgi:predicted TIM-barrel fold metal-dependent hydrolase